MTGTPDDSAPLPPDAVTANLDRDRLKDAHGRTGRMLQNAGLPYEEEEFDEADADETSQSSEEPSGTEAE